MEPASIVRGVSLPENLRKGQKETVELALSGKDLVVTQLPTGYGKTMVAVCCYGALRQSGRVNRLLYVCPRRNQAKQAEEIPGELAKYFNIDTKAVVVGDEPILAMRRHRENAGEIYIATIQGLSQGQGTWRTVSDLLSTGRWAIVIDEHHHYSGDGVWAERIKRLSCQFMLAMSATPRQDGKSYFPPPHVRATYFDALREQAVKELHLHEYEYVVDVITEDNDVISCTTGKLLEELGVSDLDAVDEAMVKRKMRWSPKYISPLITHPADRLADLRVRGIKSQMIVQAMSCAHAEMVCQQVRALLPTMKVDWVGTGPNGRSQKDNEDVLARFCPPKDSSGRRAWSLDVLVNVGMAGEGLDTVDVTEISILTPASINPSLLQLIGRAARRMSGHDQPIACVNIDTDSELAKDGKYRGMKIMGLFDDDIVDVDEIEEGEASKRDDEYREAPDEPFLMVSNVRLVDIKTDPAYEPLVKEMLVRDVARQKTEEEWRRDAEGYLRDFMRQRDERLNAETQLGMLKDQIDALAGKIAGLVCRRMSELGVRLAKEEIGNKKRRINSEKKRQFGPIDACDVEERMAQWRWLKELERAVLLEQGIAGVPKWLR